MAKRFTSTEIWSEDWFLDMPNEYKLFWFYVLSECNHAGIFKVNLRSFCSLHGVKVTSKEAVDYFNTGKDRIRVVADGVWLIEDFFAFQYGSTFNPNNRVHESIEKEYKKIGVALTSIRGLIDLKDRVKDKDIVVDAPSLDSTINGTNKNLNGTALEPKPKSEKEIEFEAFQKWVLTNAPQVAKMKEPFTFDQWQKATAEFGKLAPTLRNMHNYKPLLTKNVSAYLTLCNWARRDAKQSA